MGWIDNLEDIMTHQHSFYYYLFAIVITLFACIFTAVYMEAGEEGVVEFIAKRYFRAEAKAEEKALEKAGEGAAQDFLKDRLKKNPALDNKELNEIAPGLGDEAKEQFGKMGKMLS